MKKLDDLYRNMSVNVLKAKVGFLSEKNNISYIVVFPSAATKSD